MGLKTPFSTSFQLPDGREVILETGKLGTQAHGSAVVKLGKTMLFASVVSNKEAKEGQDFFPLSVDYQENLQPLVKFLVISLEENPNYQIMKC